MHFLVSLQPDQPRKLVQQLSVVEFVVGVLLLGKNLVKYLEFSKYLLVTAALQVVTLSL